MRKILLVSLMAFVVVFTAACSKKVEEPKKEVSVQQPVGHSDAHHAPEVKKETAAPKAVEQAKSETKPAQNTKAKISKEEAKTRVVAVDSFNGPSLNVVNEVVINKGDFDTLIEGRKDVYGKPYYVFGFKEGNGSPYIVDVTTGDVYEGQGRGDDGMKRYILKTKGK